MASLEVEPEPYAITNDLPMKKSIITGIPDISFW